jgi:soluble lytic murein transglycosylase
VRHQTVERVTTTPITVLLLTSWLAVPGLAAEPLVPPITATATAASVEAARLAYATGDLHGAGRILTSVLETYDERVAAVDKALARFMLGVIFSEQQRWEDAAKTLLTADRKGPLADHVAFRLGKALTHTGDLEGALAAYDRVRSDANSTLRHEAAFEHAKTLFALGRHKEALAAHRTLAEVYPKAPALREVRLRIAESLLALGQTARGANVLRDIARDFPGSHAAVVAHVRLAVLRIEGVEAASYSTAERLDHGTFLRSDKRWDEAIAWLDALVADLEAAGDGRSSTAVSARREAARAAFGKEDYEDALRRWRELMALRPTDWTRSQVAECLQRLGRVDEAVDEHEKRGRGNAVQLTVAELYLWEGRYKEAYEILSKHANGSAGSRWQMAWLDYRLGRHEKAARAFGEYAGRFGSWERAVYWQARALARAGKKDRAAELYTSIVERDPLTYYSLQANNRLYELGIVRDEWKALPPDQQPDLEAKGARIHWPAAAPAMTRTAGALPGRLSPVDDGPVDLLERLAREHGDALPELRKADLLVRAGQLEEARTELKVAMATFLDLKAGVPPKALVGSEPNLLHDNRRVGEKEGLWGMKLGHTWKMSRNQQKAELARLVLARKLDGSFRTDLSLAMSRIGDWYQGRSHAFRTGRMSAWPKPDEIDRWRAAYPRAYPEAMGFFTDHYELHPELMWAVMRVESAFNPWAISVAGARGLLQVMPKTGRLIAARAGYGEFSQEMLLEPEMSIYFGTWYMRQLIDKFNGQEPLAITSYNTGPHRISYWLSRKGGSIDYDEFQEETPYLQGREYTKKVLKYVLLYRWLYDGVRVLYVPNTLDAAFADNINF